ncbi:MAG: ATP-binding protein [Acidobacteriota bacterium]
MQFHRRHRHLLFLSFALVLATVVAALGGTSFQRYVEGFQPVAFEAEAQQGVWRVTRVMDPDIGLELDDEIFAINQQQPASFSDIERQLRNRASSVILLRRDNELEAVTYARPGLEIDFSYLILAAVGAIYLLIGLYTAFKDRHLQARLFFLWCVTTLAVYVLKPPLSPNDVTDELIFVFDQFARSLLPALTLHLFLVFPSRLISSPKWARAVPLVYLPSALLIAFHADQIYGGQTLFGPATEGRIAWISKAELYFLVLSTLFAALILARRFLTRPDWENRRQAQWIAFGMVGGYLPFLVLYVIPSSFDLAWPAWTEVLGVLPLALVPLAFSWAILKYKLLDIGVVLRDSISYSMTILVGLFGFGIINMAIRQGVAEDLSLARNLLTFAAGVVIAGVLAPARSAISSSVERLQFRGSLGPRRELAGLGQDLIHERDLDLLCETLLDRLADGLVTRANLFLAQGGAMVPVELQDGLPRELSFDAFGVEFWNRDVESISAINLPSERATPQQLLFMAGYRYAFPLVVREQRIGVALVSYKYDDEPLTSEDLDLARGLLNQVALAIENAQLLEEVNRKLVEVTRLERDKRGILESSPAGIAVLDASQRVVSANHAFAAIAEVSRPEVAGSWLRDLIPVAPLPSPEDGMIEVSFCRLSGEECHLQLSLAPYHQSDEAEHRVLIVQDISARISMEHELQEKERLASLGMLAAGVAHEVNTPLTGISSYAQLLLADADEADPSYEILKKMERQTFRAAQIVNNLLEFARNRRDELVPIPLDAVLDECIHLLRDRASTHGTEIIWQRPEEQLIVVGHEGELHQVFTNLIVNAIDAIGQKGGRITVDATREEHRIRVRIADTGPGIPAARIDRIFQPFFSSKLTKGGSGLGLAITSNIVRRHAGEIRVENNQDGPGCMFTVELRRHEA